MAPTDPRTGKAVEWLLCGLADWQPSAELEVESAQQMLDDLDELDPLRRLLADEDRAVDLIGVAIAHADGRWTAEEWEYLRQNNPAFLRSTPAYEMAQAVLAELLKLASGG